jgi:hypothetical protein
MSARACKTNSERPDTLSGGLIRMALFEGYTTFAPKASRSILRVADQFGSVTT